VPQRQSSASHRQAAITTETLNPTVDAWPDCYVEHLAYHPSSERGDEELSAALAPYVGIRQSAQSYRQSDMRAAQLQRRRATSSRRTCPRRAPCPTDEPSRGRPDAAAFLGAPSGPRARLDTELETFHVQAPGSGESVRDCDLSRRPAGGADRTRTVGRRRELARTAPRRVRTMVGRSLRDREDDRPWRGLTSDGLGAALRLRRRGCLRPVLAAARLDAPFTRR
jgi:hypothetical protein